MPTARVAEEDDSANGHKTRQILGRGENTVTFLGALYGALPVSLFHSSLLLVTF